MTLMYMKLSIWHMLFANLFVDVEVSLMDILSMSPMYELLSQNFTVQSCYLLFEVKFSFCLCAPPPKKNWIQNYVNFCPCNYYQQTFAFVVATVSFRGFFPVLSLLQTVGLVWKILCLFYFELFFNISEKF